MTRKSRIMCFLGVDIGGTNVRSLVTDASGKILGYQRIARVSCESLWQAINDCLGAVLAQSSVVHVEAAVVGAAGAGPAGNQYVCRSVEKAFGAVGLDVTPQVVTDIEIAYWSAAALGDGSILVAGTGAIAGRFSEWRCVDRRDGAGWLLGDHGSGYWIGRKALRAAAADLDRRGPSTAITRGVVEALGLSHGCTVQDLIGQTKELRPADVASFAQIVLSAQDDKIASIILAAGASELVTTVRSVGAEHVILAGGLLAPSTSHKYQRPNTLRAMVEDSLGGCTYASHPVVGACWAAGRLRGVELHNVDMMNALEICSDSRRR
ncbi:N-acetylglucosamine kinase [Cutibacterium acnes]|uniref:N-acetylglucosamine kinase n=1 Tax=Cutibacterium acnes TaxID=1747 RepID=UPI000C011A02|nr:BadF/BadG/BcrA/BcrD ATPase family protein [Cutibacterium acnes]PGF59759.1 N-acetylglucosamine kinase [Cutibacterium acnes subsp. defendens]